MVSEEILETAKCIKQSVLNVGRNAMFHSSRKKAGLFIAKNVMLKREDSDFPISN